MFSQLGLRMLSLENELLLKNQLQKIQLNQKAN